MVTSPETKSATARSMRPSFSKSPSVIAMGPCPTGIGGRTWNVPSPLPRSTVTVVRAAVGDRQVGEAVAQEVARHDRVGRAAGRQADRRRRLERAVAIAQGDRDAIRAGESDGHVEVASPLKSPTAIADGSSRVGSTSGARRGGGLERAVAGTQVDAVRGHDVEDAVVGEVADGDRRVS